MRVGVLVSGRGSNLQALIDAFPREQSEIDLAVVISNRPECAALDRARLAAIPVEVFGRDRFPDRLSRHAAIGRCLADYHVDLVVLAGYDQVVPLEMLSAYPLRIINVHPSLLPAFAGTLHAHAEALQHGVKISGCTVHFVTPEVDGGPIIAQAAVPVLENDDEQSLAARVLVEEHRLLPEVVRLLAAGLVHVQGRRVLIGDKERA